MKNKHLENIKECAFEIIELLKIGSCQRHLILDETEMILSHIACIENEETNE